MLEETNLIPTAIEQFRVYSDPKRDKRRHTVSAVFRCHVKSFSELKAGDDAKGVELVPLQKIDTLDLAFDHRQILKEYVAHFHPNL